MKDLIKDIWKWMRMDGLLHMETSALIMLIAHTIFPLLLALILSVSMGIAKEARDAMTKKGTAEMHDLYCDGIGILLGLILCILL